MGSSSSTEEKSPAAPAEAPTEQQIEPNAPLEPAAEDKPTELRKESQAPFGSAAKDGATELQTDPNAPVGSAAQSEPAKATDETEDEALAVLAREYTSGQTTVTYTREEERALKCKIDLHLMILMCIIYFLQFVDKTAVSYGSIMGMIQDNHLKGDEFSWVSSIFYFGMLGAEIPTIFLIQHFPLGKYAGFWVAAWGCILSCHAACSSYAGLLVVRFFLGVAEAAVNPSWIMLTSQWYKKDEQNLRTGIWVSMNGLSQVIGACFAYGVAIHVARDPHRKLDGWQIVFLVLGLFTFVFGVLFFFLIPDSPATAWFLSEREKEIHIERIRGNEQGVGSHKFKCDHIKEALLDPFVWLYIFHSLIYDITNSIGTSFGSIIVEGLGFMAPKTLLLLTPFGAVEFIVLPIVAWFGTMTNERLLFAMVGCLIGLAGSLMLAIVPHGPAGLVGFSLCSAIASGPLVMYSLVGTNVAGTTKKQTASALITISYAVGNIISPQTFQAHDAPDYLPSKITICVIYFVLCVLLVVQRQLNVWENNKRDRAKEAGEYDMGVDHEFRDLTDRQNLDFRYAL